MSNYNATHARNGIPVAFATTKWRTTPLNDGKQRICCVCYVGFLSRQPNIAEAVMNELPRTFVKYASYGTMIARKAFTTAMTAESAA
jgi:hypothetical protein